MQLLEVPLGGEMKINTADGPMLVSVGNHMQCQQCSASFGSHGLSQLASCPCSVAVTGSKDGQYYEGESATFNRVEVIPRALVDQSRPTPELGIAAICTSVCSQRDALSQV